MIKLSYKVIMIALVILCFVTCGKNEAKETILEGKTSVWTDETLTPIIEDQIMVFESQYNAKIDLTLKSEAEVINALMKDSVQIAILSRNLTPDELKFFATKNVNPRMTKFASDGVALITNKKNTDTLISLSDVLDFIKGKPVAKIKGLAFDNPNSSTLRYLNGLAGVKESKANLFSFNNNVEAIKYVAENDGIIGVIGLNWLSQPTPDMQPYIDKITIMRVKGKSAEYVYPSQNNLAEGKYPLARDLFVANCQGFSGLGMGFASFVAGEQGQRIILKSGLLPAKMPGRRIAIKK